MQPDLMHKARFVAKTLRRRIEAAAKIQDGPWGAAWEHEEGEYAVGQYVRAVHFPQPVVEYLGPGRPEASPRHDLEMEGDVELQTEVIVYLLTFQLPVARAILALLDELIRRYDAADPRTRDAFGNRTAWPLWEGLIDALYTARPLAEPYLPAAECLPEDIESGRAVLAALDEALTPRPAQ